MNLNRRTIALRFLAPAAALALCLLCQAQPPAQLKEDILHRNGQGGYVGYRIPAAVVSDHGTIVLLTEGRRITDSDFGPTDLLCRRSADGGRSWSKQQIIWREGIDEEGITIGNPAPVYDADTHRIIVLYTRDNREVFVTDSSDQGRTWTRPRNITCAVCPTNWTRYWTGPGHGLQIHEGAKRGRLIIPSYHFEEDPTGIVMPCHTVYSDDHGATWHIGESIRLADGFDRSQLMFSGDWIPPAGGAALWAGSESMACELPGGSLYLMIRNEVRYRSAKAYSWSRDGGETWTPLKLQLDLPDFSCQSAIIRWPNFDGGNRDAYLVSTIASSEKTGPTRGRRGLTTFISRDGCRTWQPAKLLHQGPAAYSELVLLPDGHVLCFFEGGDVSAYDTIRQVRFDSAWLRSR